ncbi:unnamed protein product, partial [Dibothriocephalus latus]
MDEEASRALVNWSNEQDSLLEPDSQRIANGNSPSPADVVQGGIVSRFAAPLSLVPPSQWAGLLVRPVNLPPKDPGGFAVSGANVEGLCGNKPISPQMAAKLPEYLRQCGDSKDAVSYATFLKYVCTNEYSETLRHHGINENLPLVSTCRISRHLNAAN